MTATSSSWDLTDLRGVLGEWCSMHLTAESLTEAEALAGAVGRQVTEWVFAQLVAQWGVRLGYAGPQQPCACGARARFVGYRERWVQGLSGQLRVQRAYYHCAACHQGCVPWDAAQGLNDRLWTPAIKALVAELAAQLPYREVARLLARHFELELAESSLEALLVEVGQRLRAEEAQQTRSVCHQAVPITPVDPQEPLPVGPASRLYISLDAAKAHTGGEWHDIKVGVIYTGAPPATAPQGGDQVQERRYVAAQEPASAFGERLYTRAVAAGYDRAAEVVLLGDGAPWIWNVSEAHFAGCVEILDYFHACEHIWEVSRSLYGAANPAGARWAQAHCRKLKEQGPAPLLRALRRRKAGASAVAEVLQRTRNYFTLHRSRMNYPAYQKRGLMIGSGPVEAACKVVVGQRLKQAGMRWSEAGADAMLAVRTAVLNGH